MIITVPRILRRSHIAFMLIEGGLNTDPIPTSSSVTDFGVSTGSVAVELRQIPNEPIRFMADPAQKSRTEDALIAWTWMTFIEQNGTNPYVLLRLPMTKDYFWDDLQVKTGGSYLRRIPNTGHHIQGYQGSLQSFYLSISDKQILPSFKWTRIINETHGQILGIVDFSVGQPKPINVTAYQARSVTGTK
ncbi:unnamed protein product [Rotaria sp. Silwood2]|nr:unnamed protein product [Rotaria sp. Silwood2]CAF3183491.1 unnamed protein product [Rotaria sp. Silwood2]